jgi:hypothetical protein
MLAALIVACGGIATPPPEEQPNPSPVTDLDQVADQIDEMWEQWESQAPQEYQFEFRWNCFCPPGFREWAVVAVEDGEVVSVAPAEADLEEDLPPASEYRTIAGLYNLLKEAVQQQAHQIDLEFDQEQAVPTFVYIDYDALITDEERGFELRSYTAR